MFHGWKIEVYEVNAKEKKKGKEKEEKYRARASVYGHATVVQRDAYVRTPFINNAVVHWFKAALLCRQRGAGLVANNVNCARYKL